MSTGQRAGARAVKSIRNHSSESPRVYAINGAHLSFHMVISPTAQLVVVADAAAVVVVAAAVGVDVVVAAGRPL